MFIIPDANLTPIVVWFPGPPCISTPLGMENGAIPDAKITASSYYSSSYYPRYARLNG